MRILFIGGTGNISTDCAALLHERGHEIVVGNNVSINLEPDSIDEGRRLFDLRRWLAEGRNTTLQGRSTCMPISLEERGANPNVSGAQ